MNHVIHRLHMASVKSAGEYNPPTYLDTRINVYSYLIVTASDVVLIDTGIGKGIDWIDSDFEPRRNLISAELGRHKLNIEDVTMVINSHLHFDHCGNNKLFPTAKIFVQADELAVASTDPDYTVKEWFDFEGAQITPVHGDLQIIPGIQLLHTPGHTPGHQSILVETSGGKTLIAAQAAYTADEYQRGGDAELQACEGFKVSYLQSIARLKSLAGNWVYFSHDDRVVFADGIEEAE